MTNPQLDKAEVVNTSLSSPPTNSSNNLSSCHASQETMSAAESSTKINIMIDKKESTTAAKSTTTAKSLPSSSKTPRSSSVTAFHSKNFRFHTCCGVIELNLLKLTSFFALFVSFLAFASLIGILGAHFSIISYYESTLADLSSSGNYRELMKSSCRIAVLSQYNRTWSLEYVNMYNNYFRLYYDNINSTIEKVPSSILYWNQYHMDRNDIKSRRAVKMEVIMMSQVMSGNYTEALQTLDSDYYQYLLTGYGIEVQSIYDYVEDLKDQTTSLNLSTSTAALVIICVSIVIVVPVLIVYIILSIKKDVSKERRLRQVKKYLIMDTINDVEVAEKFKEFCKQERSEENFALLDKINEYKKLCERSFEIQVYLYDTEGNLSTSTSDQFSTSSAEEASKKKNKNKKGCTEKDLLDIEKKKFEIAFEIFTDFLDVRGDRSVNISKAFADNVKQHLDFFAKGENESMPESLFETIEYEMCVLMMDTHHRFKQYLELQALEKKQILSTLKKSKKK